MNLKFKLRMMIVVKSQGVKVKESEKVKESKKEEKVKESEKEVKVKE